MLELATIANEILKQVGKQIEAVFHSFAVLGKEWLRKRDRTILNINLRRMARSLKMKMVGRRSEVLKFTKLAGRSKARMITIEKD